MQNYAIRLFFHEYSFSHNLSYILPLPLKTILHKHCDLCLWISPISTLLRVSRYCHLGFKYFCSFYLMVNYLFLTICFLPCYFHSFPCYFHCFSHLIYFFLVFVDYSTRYLFSCNVDFHVIAFLFRVQHD